MELKLIDKEECASRASEILGMAMFRPAHRVVNFFDKKNGRIYLTEFQDFMAPKKEEFNIQTQKSLAVEIDAPDIAALLPDGIDLEFAIVYCVHPTLYFVQVKDRFFAVGQRLNHQRMSEERADGLELIEEVGLDGEFRFVFLPRVGMCIRGLSRYDYRGRRHDFEFTADEEEMNRVSFSGLFHLVRSTGIPVLEEFGEDEDLVRKFLGATVGGDEESAWRLRNWTYPTFWDGDNEPRRRWGKGELLRGRGRFANSARAKDVSFEAGSGKVTVQQFEGEDRVETCTPWLEYSFAETFYGS